MAGETEENSDAESWMWETVVKQSFGTRPVANDRHILPIRPQRLAGRLYASLGVGAGSSW